MYKNFVMACVVMCSFLVQVLPAEASLSLGAKAPPLKMNEWVQGAPFSGQWQENELTVVVFWATWCPSCNDAMPILEELAEKFKDSTVSLIAITDDDKDTVKTYLEAQSGKSTSLSVALDPEAKVHQMYGVTGIPQAFAISQEGAILWSGHPLNGLAGLVEKAADGHLDIQTMQRIAAKAQQEKKIEVMLGIYTEIIATVDDQEIITYFFNRLTKLIANDEQLLDFLAYTTYRNSMESIKPYTMPLALQAIQAANLFAKGSNASILDTYASVLDEMGKGSEGIKLQEKAVALCTESEECREYRERLQVYTEKYSSDLGAVRWYFEKSDGWLQVSVELSNELYLYAEKTKVTIVTSNGEVLNLQVAPKQIEMPAEKTADKSIYSSGETHVWKFQSSEDSSYSVSIDYQGCSVGKGICLLPQRIEVKVPASKPQSLPLVVDNKIYLGPNPNISSQQ